MNKTKDMQFVALGGSGEIGMNCNLYGYGGKWLMVDLGVSFGSQDYPGTEIILPDTQFIEDRADDLVGIVLTHGHEDHIGAVPYLAADLGVPLYANAFTADMIAGKLEQEGLTRRIKLNRLAMDGRASIGPFDIELVQLAHSIPSMSAVVISTPAGRVFHSADWKLDDDPDHGEPAAQARVRAACPDGVDVLVCDSTNAFNADAAGSEASVVDGLTQAVAAAKGRVLVTSFASNLARLITLGRVARATGRRLCIAGRSLDRIIGLADKHEMLKDFPDTVDFDTAMSLPRGKLMVVVTGGQGEPRAALARIASDNHQIKLSEGDSVIFSSRQIPGNELAIGRIMNQLAAKGVLTVTERQAHIHVSGHPGKPELAALYDWVRPNCVVPVHGEIRHMREQARWARECGVPHALVQTNGQLVRLLPGPAKIVGDVPSGRLVIDGNVIIPADGEVINDRRKLATSGYLAVAVAAPFGAARQISVRMRGLPVTDDGDAVAGEVSDAVAKVLDDATTTNAADAALQEKLRLAARRVITRWTDKKPVVDILLLGG